MGCTAQILCTFFLPIHDFFFLQFRSFVSGLTLTLPNFHKRGIEEVGQLATIFPASPNFPLGGSLQAMACHHPKLPPTTRVRVAAQRSLRRPQLNRPEILRRLGLDGKDVVQIDFHAIPHESANASRTCRDSSGRSVLEVRSCSPCEFCGLGGQQNIFLPTPLGLTYCSAVLLL